MDAVSFLKAVRPLVVVTCKMERVIIATGDVITKDIPFVSRTGVNLEATDVNELYTNAVDKMMESMAIFLSLGSGWRFVAVQKLDINTVKYEPVKGSSYIPLPKYLADKKAIINLKNEDSQCFKWCLARALNPVGRDSERVTKELRKQAEELNWNGITFPVTLNEIDKFERNNTALSINVFGHEERFFYPLQISKHERKDVVDLLLISNDSTNHYCLVNNLSRLLLSQVSNNQKSRLFCRRCLNNFRSKEALDKHKRYCNQHEAVRPECPNLVRS